MENEKKIIEINEKIAEIDRKLEKLNKKEDKEPIGMISLINGYVNIELLLDEKLIDDDKLKRLENIANQLQQ